MERTREKMFITWNDIENNFKYTVLPEKGENCKEKFPVFFLNSFRLVVFARMFNNPGGGQPSKPTNVAMQGRNPLKSFTDSMTRAAVATQRQGIAGERCYSVRLTPAGIRVTTC